MNNKRLEKRSLRDLSNKIRIRILHNITKHIIGSDFRVIFHKWRGVRIGKNVFIGGEVHLDDTAPSSIIIENGAMLSAGVLVLVHQRDLSEYKKGDWIGDQRHIIKPVHIRKGANIGVRSIIMPGVTVGKGAIIGAGSVVTRDIPDYCIAAGIPAKIVREL